VMPLRATADDEMTGLDVTMHGEEAYLHAGGMEAVMAMPREGREERATLTSPIAAR
jgi:hypothetical protein